MTTRKVIKGISYAGNPCVWRDDSVIALSKTLKSVVLSHMAFVFAFAGIAAQAATCYTVPDEYKSSLWEAMVDGHPNGVASARTCDPPIEHYDYGGEYAFTSFEMDAPAKVIVRSKSKRNLSRVRILPASAPVTLRSFPDGTLELLVSRPCCFSVEPEIRRNPLLVFANPSERSVPDESDPKVKTFGPGVHIGGENGRIELKDGETLYLKAGAFVKGGIYASGNNIRICGRGVLDSSPWGWRSGPTSYVVWMKGCRDITVEDITIRGASHWTVVPANCDGVTVRNVKLCGGRVHNDDGINPCNSRNVLIENCFVRTDDDCIAAKGMNVGCGNCENVTVRNCVFWCDKASVVKLGHESRAPYMRNFLFENCDVIHFRSDVFIMEPGEEMHMENIRVRDFRMNTDIPGRKCTIVTARPTVNKYMRTKVPGHIADCSFENMTVTGARANCRFLLEGRDDTHRLTNVTISNATFYGESVKAGAPAVCIGALADNVVVKPGS